MAATSSGLLLVVLKLVHLWVTDKCYRSWAPNGEAQPQNQRGGAAE